LTKFKFGEMTLYLLHIFLKLHLFFYFLDARSDFKISTARIGFSTLRFVSKASLVSELEQL